jgi:hypothetical protein
LEGKQDWCQRARRLVEDRRKKAFIKRVKRGTEQRNFLSLTVPSAKLLHFSSPLEDLKRSYAVCARIPYRVDNGKLSCSK